MLVVTIECWDAKDDNRRSQLHQVVIGNLGQTPSPDGATSYVAYLFGPDDHVPTRGVTRAQVSTAKAITEVYVRHRPAHGDLELLFTVMREFRQEVPHLFEAPPEEEPSEISPEALKAWRNGRVRRINS